MIDEWYDTPREDRYGILSFPMHDCGDVPRLTNFLRSQGWTVKVKSKDRGIAMIEIQKIVNGYTT